MLHVKPRELAGWVAKDEGTQRSKEKRTAVKATWQSNLDGRLASAAINGWLNLHSSDSLTYTYDHQDGRHQLVGSYEEVLRLAGDKLTGGVN